MIIKNTKNNNTKTVIITASLLVILALLVVAYFYIHKNSASRAQTTSKAPTAQSNYTQGEVKENASSSSISQGGAIDNAGKVSSDTSASNQSTWLTSDSGAITLKHPVANSTLKTGDELSGSSTLDKVYYRLVDSTAGVIAQGSLEVVDGNFSGSLQFHKQGESGTLVVYSFDQQGKEINRVKAPVSLQ